MSEDVKEPEAAEDNLPEADQADKNAPDETDEDAEEEDPDMPPEGEDEPEYELPLVIQRNGYKIHVVDFKDNEALSRLRETGKSMGEIAVDAVTTNDRPDEAILAIKD